MSHSRSWILVAAGLLAANAAWGAESIERGRDLAREYCEKCHDISEDGAFKTYPPSFASIAVFRSEDQIRGRIMFQSVHTGMPRFGFILLPDELDSLVAFIRSLEKAR